MKIKHKVLRTGLILTMGSVLIPLILIYIMLNKKEKDFYVLMTADSNSLTQEEKNIADKELKQVVSNDKCFSWQLAHWTLVESTEFGKKLYSNPSCQEIPLSVEYELPMKFDDRGKVKLRFRKMIVCWMDTIETTKNNKITWNIERNKVETSGYFKNELEAYHEYKTGIDTICKDSVLYQKYK